MNKTQLIDTTAEAVGLSKADTGRVVDALLDIIMQKLARGEQVNMPGFGSFNVQIRKARTGRDPRTGNALVIKAKPVVKFKTGIELRKAVESEEMMAQAAKGG